MKSRLVHRLLARCVNAWLLIRIHLDAFRVAPRAYLTATKWWILRKRVRARGQFAHLLVQSRYAYMLWGLRSELSRAHSAADQAPVILALVDWRGTRTGDNPETEPWMRSLRDEHVDAFAIGNDTAGDLATAIAAINWSQDPWFLLVHAGDLIAPGTATAYRSAMTEQPEHIPQAQVGYADDDLLDRWDRRIAPHFKPDWNAELLRHHDYVTGSCVARATKEDLLSVSARPDWMAALVALAAARGPVVHVQEVLHHRRQRAAPRLPAAPTNLPGDLPPVTVVVPTRNRVDLLRTCLDGLAATDYPDLDVVVVDNDSDDRETLEYLNHIQKGSVRVLRHPGAFNYSTINNRAVHEARGTLVCLLNNDIEIIAPDWLKIMACQAIRNDVGAVGAQLLYPDGRIQHAGVVIGVGNAAGHAHRLIVPEEEGYFNRHALPQFTTAVTAACLVVAKERFNAVGGLNERDFAVAYNDVDLCLRLNQRGWQSFYEPRAVLIHHESVSRGLDLDPVGAARFAGELAALKRIWKTDEIVDPYHHPQLSRATERFSVAL